MGAEREPIVRSEIAGRLYKLFAANQRSCGQFDPKTSKVKTIYRGPTVQDFMDHLDAKMGLGCVPINDDDRCAWAAIDIDNHGQDEDIPIAPIDATIRKLKLPVIACRSKSGGVHAYVFFEKPQPANRVRAIMAGWAKALGHGGAEIFPKQAVLRQGADGKKQLGNWINLPYLGADASNRYAFYNSKRLGVSDFLDLAEKRRATEVDLANAAVAEHPEAPPCVQRMMTEGVPTGHRNEAMYQTVIYLRKAFPEEIDAYAQALNGTMFERPLPRAEFTRTVQSASRADYGFRCNEEPAHSFCDKTACLKRKFGISRTELDHQELNGQLPKFSGLVQYNSDPVRYEIRVDGKLIANLSSDMLMEWRVMRKLCFEKLHRVLPMMKDSEWGRILQEVSDTDLKILDTPEDASVAGVVRERLREFASRVDMTNRGQNTDDRRALLRGLPVIQEYEGERMVMFRAQDFINYLKRTKAEELKGVNMWFAIKDMGVGNTRLRVGDADFCRVWYLPVKEVLADHPRPEAPTFKSKL